VKLLPGDVIYFNALGPVVAMNGSVNAPAIFELRGQQTLQDVLQLAGGLTATASSQKATVERVDGRKARHVEELALDYDGLSKPLKNADIVTVHSITGRFENSVLLRGNVENPGRYPWKENLRVKDLLPSYESLISRNYWQQKTTTARQATAGATPGVSTLKNEIIKISPDINWDYAVVERLNTEQLTAQLLPFNLRRALSEPESPDNLVLMPGDVITIFSQDDIQVPEAKRSKFVYLEGEFKAAGVYRAEPGETLRQLVERVGITEQAYLFGSEFRRVTAQQQQQVQLAAAVHNFEGEIERNAQIRLSTTTNPNDPSVMQFQQSLQNQRRIVDQMRQIVPTGRVVLNIRPADETLAAFPDVPLEDGDRLIIPARPAFVNVIGAVNANTSLLYAPGLRARDYVSKAGGATRYADTRHMFVVRANGAVISQRGWSGTVGSTVESARLMPGDTVVVPEELDRGAFMRALKDWTQILGQIGLGAAAIKVLRQ
jgi:polysaccharide biosynthesis/export protein